MVLVKTEFGKIIGGFNPFGWKSSLNDKWFSDHEKKSFLFSVDLKRKMQLINPEFAIYNQVEWGPSFGYDLCLANECNIRRRNYSGFPDNYGFASEPYVD